MKLKFAVLTASLFSCAFSTAGVITGDTKVISASLLSGQVTSVLFITQQIYFNK